MAKKHAHLLAFSLMELLVVVAIMAILLAAGIVSYSSVTRRSRDAKRKADMEQIRQALELYRADNLSYPGACTDYVSTCLSGAAFSTYMSTLPSDPKLSTDALYGYRYERVSATQYCLTAFMEVEPAVTVAGCTSVSNPPSGTNLYIVTNP